MLLHTSWKILSSHNYHFWQFQKNFVQLELPFLAVLKFSPAGTTIFGSCFFLFLPYIISSINVERPQFNGNFKKGGQGMDELFGLYKLSEYYPLSKDDEDNYRTFAPDMLTQSPINIPWFISPGRRSVHPLECLVRRLFVNRLTFFVFVSVDNFTHLIFSFSNVLCIVILYSIFISIHASHQWICAFFKKVWCCFIHHREKFCPATTTILGSF